MEVVIQDESSEKTDTSTETVRGDGEPLRKKQKYDADLQEKIFVEGLEAYLMSDRVRKRLLSQKEEMTSAGRSELVQVVVNYLRENYAVCGNIPFIAFEKASREIVEVFPNESALLYFVAPKKKTKQHPGTKASGKLYARYYNEKRPLNKGPSTSSDSNETATRQQQNISGTIASTPNASFQHLRGEVEITKEYIEHWHMSAEPRRQLLEKEGIEMYFFEIPALTTSQGYKLLLEDFDVNYPIETLKLLHNWNDLASKIVLYCKQKEIIADEHVSASTGKFFYYKNFYFTLSKKVFLATKIFLLQIF